jgi:hypothetical protein
MITRRGSKWRAPIVILAICAGLAWFLYRELQAAPPLDPGSLGDSQLMPLPSLPAELSFAMPSAKTFSESVERPIFSPTRLPPPEGTNTIESPKLELDATLVAVIISAEERIAILKPKTGPQFVRLSEGDRFQDWTLKTIEPDRVTFWWGELEQHIELTYQEQPPVGKPRRK